MGIALLAVPETTIHSLEQVASSLGESAETLADKAITHYLRQVAAAKIEQEEIHYRTQHQSLLAQYADQYIALHEGNVIDTDHDELTLLLRVRQAYPMVGILIKQVTPSVEEVWTMRSPRMEYR